MAATVIDEAWYKANNPPLKGNWTMEILKQGWKINERKWKEYRYQMESWMERDELKGVGLAFAVNKVKKDKLVREFISEFKDELKHVEEKWLWESVSHLINLINSTESKMQKRASQNAVKNTPTPSPGKLSRRGSNSSVETLGISRMDVRERVSLGRCNIVIDHPTLGILELAVLTCLAPLPPGASRINPDEITAKDISQDVIEGMIKETGTWDEAYKWIWESEGITRTVVFRFSFAAMINSLDHDRRDDKLRLKLVNPNTQNLPGFQPLPHDMSPSFNPSSESGGSPSSATRGKPKSRGRRQTKIPPLPGTDTSITSTVFSPPPLPSSEKKGIEQPEKKRRKTGKKKVTFSDSDEAYEPLKNERARARESDHSESSEDDVRSLQETRLRRQRRGRRPTNPSDEGKAFRSSSPDKPAAPPKRVVLPSFGKELDLDGDGNEEERDSEDQVTGEEETDILGKITELKEVIANTQLSDPTWLRCCQFFKINPDDGKFKPYRVPGMSKSLYSYQIHAIEWILRTVRGIAGGCWVADEMGLGKTAQTIGLMVINYHICRIWDDIEESRNAGDGRHLPKGHAPEDICPSDNKMFFACPCKENGHGAWATPIYLPNLILSPAGIIATWTTEFYRFVDIEHKQMKGLSLHVAHGNASHYRRTAQEEFNHMQIPDLSMTKEVCEALLPAGNGMAASNHVGGLIVLTTPQSYESKVSNLTQVETQEARVQEEIATKTNRVTKEKETYIRKTPIPAKRGPGMVWGHIVVDESQDEKLATSRLNTILHRHVFAALKYYDITTRPKLIYVSGTPCQRGPTDMKVQLGYLETAEWKDDATFRHFTSSEIDRMIVTYKSLEKPDSKVSNTIRERFYFDFGVLLVNFMICRTCETDWFGKELVTLPPKHARRVEVNVKPEWKDAIDKFTKQEIEDLRKEYRLGKRLTAKTFVDKSRKLRICISFPALIPMFLAGDVDLTWKEVTSNGWHKNPETSPYWKNLNAIAASSAKIDELVHLKDNVMGKDVDGNPEKLVIMTFAPIESFILSLWYKKRGDKVGLYSSSALVKERERIKDGFQDTTNSEGDFVVVDEADRPNFLVGSLELLHKGLQLTRAFRLVLFSPDVDFGKMRQAEKRENRIGQRNEMTIMYVFFNKDSAIDEAILLSAGHIEKMIDRVLKMKAEELDSRGVDREE